MRILARLSSKLHWHISYLAKSRKLCRFISKESWKMLSNGKTLNSLIHLWLVIKRRISLSINHQLQGINLIPLRAHSLFLETPQPRILMSKRMPQRSSNKLLSFKIWLPWIWIWCSFRFPSNITLERITISRPRTWMWSSRLVPRSSRHPYFSPMPPQPCLCSQRWWCSPLQHIPRCSPSSTLTVGQRLLRHLEQAMYILLRNNYYNR